MQGIPEERDDEITRGGGDSWRYTPFFIDLVDTQNQRIVQPNGGSANDYADDRVQGYTLSQIQNALDNRTTLRGVEQHLRNNHGNPTEGDIARVRDFYQNLKP